MTETTSTATPTSSTLSGDLSLAGTGSAAQTNGTRDPADIEADIRRTQDEMSRTVDRIGDQLTPRKVIDALLDKAENNQIDARGLLEGARRNPLALALIAGGTIWLISDNDAKIPSFGGRKSSSDADGIRSPSDSISDSDGWASTSTDPWHRDYTAHMERVEYRDGEDAESYQRRRDLARANFFMIERGHDEDDHSYRSRLDKATEAFRSKRHAWADSARHAGSALKSRGSSMGSSVGGSLRNAGSTVGQQSRNVATGVGHLYEENPVVGGLVAAAIGALFGASLPLTRTEEQQLGSIGEQALQRVNEQKDKLVATARDHRDDLLEKAQGVVAGGTAGGQGSGSEGIGSDGVSSAFTTAGGPVSTGQGVGGQQYS